MQGHAIALRQGLWRQPPNWRDLVALVLIVAIILLLGSGASQMAAPLTGVRQPEISLAPSVLPNYALRTMMRMLAALLASLVFTFTYGTLAAKSRRAEMVLIPLLDVLQSVPVLGYLAHLPSSLRFTVSSPDASAWSFAPVFSIFARPAWNIAFSFFQALRTIPYDLDRASRDLRLSGSSSAFGA